MLAIGQAYHDMKCSNTVAVISAVVCLVVPIFMISMGKIHKDECPAEKYISIYLIVGGSAAIAFIVLRLLVKMWCPKPGKSHLCDIISTITSLTIALFMFAWFIAGSVWIYSLYNKYDPSDKTAANYCNNTFYVFAFWSTTTIYILIGVIVVISCGYTYHKIRQ
ncbi:transmembrane protein 272-like [Haliotis rufescens]|uniref:transmembrane protein 272-like n=1 Tax=Haliotis rufescens TaxID=6454 RepID=UPI00201F7DE9|nr:transmembrane protein 272-like [Haliotis rufescens]XP_046374195.2 transmembrane protein 272-like [Haliotis rufescens]XP_046374196.2 transmembrane protein 272-like [Haliotis rufescens]XP_046374197.2 transmembrane protein 272-like [Haliotis rufescens]